MIGKYFYLKNDIQSYIKNSFKDSKMITASELGNARYYVYAASYTDNNSFLTTSYSNGVGPYPGVLNEYNDRIDVGTPLFNDLLESAYEFRKKEYSGYTEANVDKMLYLDRYNNDYFGFSEHYLNSGNTTDQIKIGNYRVTETVFMVDCKIVHDWDGLTRDGLIVCFLTLGIFLILKFVPFRIVKK